jgi:hypothetical protein
MQGQLTSPSEVRVSTCLPAGLRTCRHVAREAPVANLRSFPAHEEPVLLSRISFLLTAAGQFRIHTGFPFSTPTGLRGCTDSFRNYSGRARER